MGGDDDLEREFPGWHWWRGVSGLYYVRRVRSSPPIVLRAETLDELREQVRDYLNSKERL
jgi:hypothetical protein